MVHIGGSVGSGLFLTLTVYKSFYIKSSPNRDKENLFIAVRQFVFLRMCQFFSFPSWLTN